MLFNYRQVLIAAAAATAFGALVLSAPVNAEETISMGAILPLTGANATAGEEMRRGAVLAVEQVNANGGVLGKKFNLIIEDSGNNVTTALTATRKLVDVDKVPVVTGEFSSSITLPMAQYIVKQGMIHLNEASTSVKIRELGANAFSVVGLEDKGNEFSSKDVWDLGLRNVAVIVPNNAYGQGVLHGFKDEFEKLGGTVIAETLYTMGQSSYRRELQQLSRSNPDAYVYTAYGQESAVINREAKELGLRDKPFYGILLSMCVSDTPADIANGELGMETGSAQGDVGKAFAAAFEAKYGAPIKVSYTAYVSDAVMLTAAAINKAGSADPGAIRTALNEISKEGSYVGITGSIRFDENGQRVDPPYAKLKVEDGKIVPR